MSIEKLNTVDALGVSDDKKVLALLISDQLDWTDEYEHLALLQDKINSYVNFITAKQYKSIYPEYSFEQFVIEIHFKYSITDNCVKFIETASQQIKQSNTTINYFVLD